MARKDTKLDALARVRLFSACSKKDLQTISKVSDEVEIAAGETLIKEGSSGHEFFLILEGEVTVKRGNRKVAQLGPGQAFGETALLDRGPRTASVIADTDLRVLVLGQREFAGVLDEVPGLAHKLLTAMAARLREADEKAYSH
ncbi:MAG TPA: cyclic nucleotide-binding domain-containing protein [Acidimicrobiales bacterium]|nr:cyclic nucleotide-binding domain-containing protein [Acidimicrobiales bacterium]